ncbi:hypothetical protein [Desulfopila aestuarii]|uniref:Uncharacterized protein n=1 Tax=Desulfopila aestuarii DSM 18488 TaxID=1121416 RepID=A0A1M7XVX2_9BACT|nr:hypothetical protein [Desulfopila aestuarii]SHO42670.1 hypothetical protein SAMN02745220_00083 [Desulfopila aestuarii DSM 18488]
MERHRISVTDDNTTASASRSGGAFHVMDFGGLVTGYVSQGNGSVADWIARYSLNGEGLMLVG